MLMAGGPPQRDPWHRRYWAYYDQPFPGCGCLWLIFICLIIWWIIAWVGGWGHYWGWR
jgi:hypothetical protein